MRRAIILCLCVLVLVGISEARSFKKASTSNGSLRSKLLAQLRSRNINLVKKGQVESEDSEDSKGGDKPPKFSLIALHITQYVAKCLTNDTLMTMVDKEVWELLRNATHGNKDTFSLFEHGYYAKEYFGCLWTTSKLYTYINEPEHRDQFDEYFTVIKEADRCNDMDGLKQELFDLDDLPDFVEEATEYMDDHCRIRTDQYVNGNWAITDDLLSSFVFDAISFAGGCLVKGQPMGEKCDYAVKSVEGYFNEYSYIKSLYADYGLTDEILEESSLLKLYLGDDLAEEITGEFEKAWRILDDYESEFEHYNEEYTCGVLNQLVDSVGPLGSLHVSDIGRGMIGAMLKQIKGVVLRKCEKESVSADNGDKDTSEEDKSADIETTRRKLQPLNSNDKMRALKRLLTDLLAKK